MNAARMGILLSLFVTMALVVLLAQPRGRDRTFLVSLGRTLSPMDLLWSRAVQCVAVACAVATAVLVMRIEDDTEATWLVVTASHIPLAALALGTIRAVLTSRQPEPTGRFSVPLESPFTIRSLASPFWHGLNVCFLLIAFVAFIAVRPHLPDQVPLQFGLDGSPTRYGPARELWLFGFIMALNTVMLWGILWTLSIERVALASDTPEAYLLLQRRRRLLLARSLESVLVSVNGVMGFLWVGLSLHAIRRPNEPPGLLLLMLGIGLVLSIVVPLIYFLPKHVRVQDELREMGGSEVLGTRASGWLLGGLFYYAPDDPAVFVPKRVGIGQTLNMARPGSWVILFVLIAGPLALVSLLQS